MLIVDTSQTSKQAFMVGFAKGFTAPVMLFGGFTAPQLPEVLQITVPSMSEEQAIGNDWRAIGSDFSKVIASYEAEANTAQ